MELLVNPLSQPLLAPTARLLGGLLGGVLGLLLIIERRHGAALWRRPLAQKWLSWAVIAPVYSLLVLAGPLPTTLLAMAISGQSLREYGRLTRLPADYTRLLLLASLVAAPLALHSTAALLALPPLIVLAATLVPVVRPTSDGLRPLLVTLFGWAYLALLPAFLVVLSRMPGAGPGLLLALGLAVALSDVGAFTVGRSLGRHPLAPRLSPSKTWEGLVGNLLGAAAGLGLMAGVGLIELSLMAGIILAGLIGLGCAWGDLVESAIKRDGGVKDAGAWLPGFGGLLDRVDSLIVVVPLVAYVWPLIGG